MSKLGYKILKMVGFIFGVTFVLLLLTNLVIFRMEFSKIQTRASAAVSRAVDSVDGDKLSKVIKEKTMESADYKEIQNSMIRFKNDENITFLYTMARGENNSTYYLVDSSLKNTTPLGEPYNLEEEMKEAFSGQVSYNKNPVKDEEGTFISAYAPIKNSSGEVIAIVGADIDVATYVGLGSTSIISYLVVGIFVLIISTVTSMLFSRKIASNVKQINLVLNRMSEGDLTVPLKIKSKDEIETIAEYIDDFRIKTLGIIYNVIESSIRVKEQTKNLSGVSLEIASSSEMVASAIEEAAKVSDIQSKDMTATTAILNKFGVKINDTANIVQVLSTEAETIDNKLKENSNVLEALEEHVKDISQSFSEVKTKIKDLSGHLEKINEITNVINGIADKTNLLALNAAIEAARAGEAGRGFSVVAEEIRKLADQSKSSSNSINLLLNSIISEGDKVIQTTDGMNFKLNEQEKVLSTSISSFRETISYVENMLPEIKTVYNNVSSINDEKQVIISNIEGSAAGSEQITASTEEISASSQNLNCASQEVSHLAEQLEEMARAMNKYVEHFSKCI